MSDPTRRICRDPWFHPAQQAAAAGVLALALGVIGLDYWWRGGTAGRMIDIEMAAPAPAVYWVDLNTAEVPELLLLPEIGEALAERIVADRAEHGPFREHQDLLRVRGIGPKTLERVRPYLRPMPPLDATAGR